MENPYKKSWQDENETMKAIGWDEGYEAGLLEEYKEHPTPLDPKLTEFYLKKGYDVCPSCGRGKEEEALTACPKGSHYGTYCLVQLLFLVKVMKCPECLLKKRKVEMRLIKEWDSSTLWKCPRCGHLTLVDGLKRQDWKRNEV